MRRQEYNRHIPQIKQILTASGLITLIFLLVKSLGFLEKLVLARYFGTGDEADAYLAAFNIPFAFFIIIEEILNPVLVPYFVEKMGKGNVKTGIKVFRKIAVGLLLILITITILGSFQSSWLISYLAPGFTGEKKVLTAKLLESLFLMLLFLGSSSLLTAVFHAHKRFNLPVLAHALQKLLIVVGILFLHDMYGIYSAVIGCVLGSVLRFLLLLYRLPDRSRLFKANARLTTGEGETRHLLILMFPLLCGVLFSQVSILVDNLVASKLAAGTIASLSYARKIVDLPILLVPFAMGIVLLPYFSLLASPEERHRFSDLLEKCLKILIFFFAFITVLVLSFSNPVVKLLFERGQFDAFSTQNTASALFWFSFGLIAFAIEIPMMQSFFALKDTKTPIIIGICCTLVNIALTLILVDFIGYMAVPIALVVQKTLKVNVLLFFLHKKVPIIFHRIIIFTVKVLGCSIFTFSILYYLKKYIFLMKNPGFVYLAINIGIGSLIALLLFIGASMVFRIQEVYTSISYRRRSLD